MFDKFEIASAAEIFIGTLLSGAILLLLTILLGKWINKMKDHFEAA